MVFAITVPVLRCVPCLHKSPLCLVFVLLRTYLLDADLCAILGEHDVLLLQLVDPALSKFVCVEEDLCATTSQ